MSKYYTLNNLCHPYKMIHVIKHAYSSTLYGIRTRVPHNHNAAYKTSFVVCFENKKDAEHVMKSLSTYKFVHGDNPDESMVCMYNTNDIIDIEESDPIHYGLFSADMYLTDLASELFNRNMGLFMINDIYRNKGTNMLNIQSIQIYPTTPFECVMDPIEKDFLL
jgi:hypothetical protein